MSSGSLCPMTVLIGITGEQKRPALVDVLEVIKALDIDVFFGDYARAVVRLVVPVWIPVDTPLEIVERLDGLLFSGVTMLHRRPTAKPPSRSERRGTARRLRVCAV